MAGFHPSPTANGESGDPVSPVGAVGGTVSPDGPRRPVPKAASSTTTSQVPVVAVSPTCSWPMEAADVVVAPERVPTGVPSSHTSTSEAAPARVMWSSTACQPAATRTPEVVLVLAASLWKPR